MNDAISATIMVALLTALLVLTFRDVRRRDKPRVGVLEAANNATPLRVAIILAMCVNAAAWARWGH